MALARAVSTLAGSPTPDTPASSKLARSFRARHGLLARWRSLAAERREPSRALVWFHAPSVGEGLQARPIIEQLRAAHPALQIAYTHFSPSAERFARGLDVDLAGYLPFDSLGDMRALVALLDPAALMFVKLDVWPNLVRAAKERGVATGLLSATLAPRSGRQGVGARMLLRDAYRALDIVGAIDSDDAERLVGIGVRRDVVEVMGDTRFDQVWKRATGVDRGSDALRALTRSPRRKIVAGSTWPSDQRVLFPAWAAVRDAFRDVQLIVAPHEPTHEHCAELLGESRHHGLTCARYTQLLRADASRADASHAHGATGNDVSADGWLTTPDADVIVLDTVGVLGDAYAVGDVAFVGGGFHAAGLHSVLEPAAYGAPVLFGPGFDMSREARLLIRERGAVSVTDATSLGNALSAWLSNDAERRAWGARAQAFVHAGLGASERAVALIGRAQPRTRVRSA